MERKVNRMKREYSDIGGIQQQAADIIRQAYGKGYKAGYVDGKDEVYKNPVPTQDAYNDGLRDAWECARKIVTMDWSIMDDKCGIDFKYYCFTAYSPSEAIAKIKEYEEQQVRCKGCIHLSTEASEYCDGYGCTNFNKYEPKQTDDECGERMDFPNTFEEFAKQYGFTDRGEHYTNGIELIPVFRVEQWIEHLKEHDDKIFGYDAYKHIKETLIDLINNYGYTKAMIQTVLEQMKVGEHDGKDKCKKCEYYINPDYTRCHECKGESEVQDADND